MKRHPLVLPALGVWFVVVLLACNLSNPETVTLIPRASATPPPTLGYATLAPEELPQQEATSAPSTNFELLNLLNQIEPDRLMFHVDTLESFGTRHVNSPYDRPDTGIGAAYSYIRKQFDAISVQTGNLVVLDYEFPLVWADVESRPRNIVAILQGSEIGAGTVVVGAHYDSITFDPDDSTSLAPGANDNGSGVAALLELARVLSPRPHRSTIMFVAFSAEEVGRQGSKAFVDGYIRAHNIELNAMIDLDIIGSSTGPYGEIDDRQMRVYSAGPNESPSRQLARSLEFLALQEAPLSIVLEDRADREGRYSDHMSFSDANIPAARFIEAHEDPKRQHNQSDTSDDVQAGYLTKATQTILALVTSLADGPRPPRNIVLRDNGNGTRTLVWEPISSAVGYVVALRRPGSLNYDQQFPFPDTAVVWDKFVPSEFAGVAVAARDANGLLGPLSAEYLIFP